MQGVDQVVQVAFDDIWEGEAEADAVVGQAALGVIIGSDALGAVTCADLAFALGGVLGVFLIDFGLE